MADDYELLDAKIKQVRNDVTELRTKIDGDPRIVNGGGTGLIGKVEKLQSVLYKVEDDVRDIARQLHEITISGQRREEQIMQLAARVDDIDRRMHPHWWDYIVVAGGFGIITMLVLQVLEYIGYLG